MIPCLFKYLFGIECLGCGLQRAIALLFKGDFSGAFQMYPAIYMVLLFIGMLAFKNIFKQKSNSKSLSVVGVLMGIFILGGYIFKNF
jgi:hypothetical protein